MTRHLLIITYSYQHYLLITQHYLSAPDLNYPMLEQEDDEHPEGGEDGEDTLREGRGEGAEGRRRQPAPGSARRSGG